MSPVREILKEAVEFVLIKEFVTSDETGLKNIQGTVQSITELQMVYLEIPRSEMLETVSYVINFVTLYTWITTM